MINDLISYDFLFNRKLFKVLIKISSGNFPSDLADQFSNVFLSINAFIFWIFLKLVDFELNFFLSCDNLRKAVYKLLHFLFLLGTGSNGDMDDSDGGDGWFMADFFNTLNGLMVFVLMSGGFLNFVGELILIWDTHFFLAFVSFAVASFPLNVSESLSKIRKGSTCDLSWIICVRICFCYCHFWFCENHTCSTDEQTTKNFYDENGLEAPTVRISRHR